MASFSSKDNTIIRGKGFWISFNPMTDTGLSETALCQKNKRPNYVILNGNHLDELRPLVSKGHDACMRKISELLENGTAKRSVWSE